MVDEATGAQDGGGTPREVITTPEGFKIHGRNETSLILILVKQVVQKVCPRLDFWAMMNH